jgi:hypothetical protein
MLPVLVGSSRHSNTEKPMKSPALVVRSWNGHAIQRRRADGYVNATAMCQAAGRRWRDYSINLRSAEYIKALEGSAGIPADLLAQTVLNGRNDRRGTWVHPRLAVDLARWISPEFAVWMDGWILEELESKTAKAAALAPESINNDDLGLMLGLLAAEVGEAARKAAAMLSLPSSFSIHEAKSCIDNASHRLGVLTRLMPLLKP